jgi:ATP-dependent Clp protease ATP-binding subunit ClpC
VGYEEGGRLTEQVRRRPYAVLLFDEIEKAHPDIFNLLLQILEDGRLTDAQGRRVDFRNTVIILTSNLGSDPRDNREPAGFGASSEKKADDPRESNALRGAFRPEFINRIDDIIRFAPLDPPALRRITRLLLEDLTRRVAAQGITLDFAEDAVDWLAGKGSGTRFGARPLRRAIVRYVENRLAMAMLTEEIQTGDRLTVSLAPERTGDEDALLLHVDSRPLTPMLPH